METTKPKISVSFSGGRTSAFMARWIQLNMSDKYDIVYVFANTGCEHERTLEFIQECDDHWNLNVVWVEAIVHHGERRGSGHRIVNFETASRNGEPFEEYIKKYGIPNKASPSCTRDLKERVILSYLREIGWRKAHIAIGIRADEIDRMNDSRKKLRLIYPLVEWIPATKEQILEWWSEQPFDLNLPEHHGNCVWCWKKSLRKLLTNVKEHPEWFEFPARMEREYPHVGAVAKKTGEPQVFFRENRSVNDLIEMAKEPFKPFHDGMPIQRGLFGMLDEAGGCSESCEIFSD